MKSSWFWPQYLAPAELVPEILSRSAKSRRSRTGETDDLKIPGRTPNVLTIGRTLSGFGSFDQVGISDELAPPLNASTAAGAAMDFNGGVRALGSNAIFWAIRLSNRSTAKKTCDTTPDECNNTAFGGATLGSLIVQRKPAFI